MARFQQAMSRPSLLLQNPVASVNAAPWRALRVALDELPAAERATAPPVALAAFQALAEGSALTSEIAAAALAGLHWVHPYRSLVALRCSQALVSALSGQGTALGIEDANLLAEGHVCQARIHVQRREGAEATTAVQRARSELPARSDRVRLAWCTLLEGQGLAAQGRLEVARPLLVAARTAFRRLHDAQGQAEAALALSHNCDELADFAAAQTHADAAQQAAGASTWLAHRARSQRADLLVSRARYGEAGLAYEALIVESQAHDWAIDTAHIRLMQGLVRTQEGAFIEAEAHLTAAVARYAAEEASYFVAVCQRAFANLYRNMSRYEEALVAIQAALASFQALGHALAVGRCFHVLGILHHVWNHHDEALTAYDAAIERYHAAGYGYGELVVEMNRATIQELRGHSHLALASYERAFAGGQSLRLLNVAAAASENMAVLNGRLGRYDEAVLDFRRARRAHIRTHNRFHAAICAAEQAGVLHLQGRTAAARRLLAQARRFFQADQRPGPLAFCELTLGEITAGAGHPDRALTHYAAALAYFEHSGQTLDAAVCRLYMGEAYLALGAAEHATGLLTAALGPLATDLPDLAARAEHALGRAAQASGQLAAAAQHWQAAVEHIAVARRGIVTEVHAGSFFESRQHIYEDALTGWLALHRPAAALAVVEASKGQVLAQLLGHRAVLASAFIGQTPEVQTLWEQLWQANRELDALRTRWPAAEAGGTRSLVAFSDALRRTPGDAISRLAPLADRQAQLFARIRHTAASIDLLDPATTFSLARLRAQAAARLGAGWGALVYYLRSNQVIVFWLTAEDVQAWTHPLSRLDLAKLRQAVDPALQQRELVYAGRLRGVPQPMAPGPRLLRDLARLLIPDPVAVALAEPRPLVIVPHGLLHMLPFHALPLPDGRPLLEHATVTYAPTLHVWEALNERQANQPAGRLHRALVCGVEAFGPHAPGLAFVHSEARDVAEAFGSRARLLLGRAVTRQQLEAWSADGTLAGFDLLHLATHAVFDRARPLQSRILLADGAWDVPDLFRLRLNARLVTLSACQTALSACEPGDELLGLREALLFAGAGALLVSLWPVDDASTGRLMVRFYDELQRGAAAATALATAQRALRAEGESAFHWAPFVMIG